MKIFEGQKNLAGVESIMRAIVSSHPKEKNFRRALASYYAGSGRKDEAEREMRALADAAPDDEQAGLELAEFVRVIKGTAAAREELARRIEGGGEDSGHYRFALARLEFADGKADEATKILNGIIAKGEPREDVRQAKVLLAQMQLAAQGRRGRRQAHRRGARGRRPERRRPAPARRHAPR